MKWLDLHNNERETWVSFDDLVLPDFSEFYVKMPHIIRSIPIKRELLERMNMRSTLSEVRLWNVLDCAI